MIHMLQRLLIIVALSKCLVHSGPSIDRLIGHLVSHEQAAGHPIPHSCNPLNNLTSWPKNPVLDYVHIPKCGGGSFNAIMRGAHYGFTYLTAQKCYMDVFPAPTQLRKETQNTLKLVLFRSPVTHVHSQFSMCRDSPWAKKKRQHNMNNHFPLTKNYTHDYEVFLDHFTALTPSEVGPLHDYDCQDPRETQTRHMSCDVLHNSKLAHQMHSVHPANHAFLSPLNLTLAIRNMQEAAFIGLVEFFSQSMEMLSYKLSGNIRLLNNYTHITHGTTAFQPSEEILRLLPKVHTLTELDKKLYHAALLRFLCDMRQVEAAAKFDQCILCDDDVVVAIEELVAFEVMSGNALEAINDI